MYICKQSCKIHDCFLIMTQLWLRLSQNERPLVFVCALGGRSTFRQVRIGLPTDLNPKYTYDGLDGTVEYQNSDIKVLIQELIDFCPEGRKVRKWSEVNRNND